MNKVVPVACLWAVLWLSNWALPRWQEETFQAPQEHRRRLDVMLDLLGESRTLLARYLWFTAENYHDMLEKQGANGFQEKDVIPLYRMIAYLDPKVEEAFDILAADMWFGFHDVEKSLEIVNEGLDYNPKSYLLNYRKAFTLIRSQRFAEAVAPAQLMLQYAKSDIDTLNSCRLLYSCYEDQKRYDEALNVLDIWIELRPQDERPRHEREKALKALGRSS